MTVQEQRLNRQDRMEEATQPSHFYRELIEKLKKSIAHRQFLSTAGILLIFIGVVVFCVTQSENVPLTLTINRAKFSVKTIPNSTSNNSVLPLPLPPLPDLSNELFYSEAFNDTLTDSDTQSSGTDASVILNKTEPSFDEREGSRTDASVILNTTEPSFDEREGSGPLYTTYYDDYIGES